MQVAVYIAVALAVVIAPAGRLAARHLAPRPATLTLVAVSVCTAAGWIWSLSLLAATLVNSAPASADRLLDLHMSQDPVPAWVGLGAALLVGAGGGRLVQVVSEEIRRVRATHRVGMACSPGGGELLVIADPVPQAFVVPSLLRHPGRIVVSSAMLRALDADERAVLLAHERSHLHNRHSWLRSTVGLAAALHPLMGRIGDQLAVALECWADEDAAHMVADRRVAARALGRAALATLERAPSRDTAPKERRPAEPFLRTRIAALLGEAPRSRWRPVLGPGRWIGISRSHLVLAEGWFSRRGLLAVFLGRLPPAVRTCISFPAGLARVDPRRFAVLTVAGALPWCAALAAAGYALGSGYDRVSGPIGRLALVGGLCVVAGVGVWLHRGRAVALAGSGTP